MSQSQRRQTFSCVRSCSRNLSIAVKSGGKVVHPALARVHPQPGRKEKMLIVSNSLQNSDRAAVTLSNLTELK